MRNTTQWIAVLGLSLVAFACEEKASTEAQPAEKAAEVAKPAPKAEVKPASVKQEAAPVADTSWQLTDARRAAIEGAVADAKGFVDAQQQLAMDKPADSAAAIKSLDSAAKGKWLLLIGSVSKVSPTGVEITLASSDSSAPSAPAAAAEGNKPAAAPAANAPAAAAPSTAAAASSVAINVTQIDAFKQDAYQVDQKVVLLAKYTGAGQAQPAYDVVTMGQWNPAVAAPAAAGTQPVAAQPAAAQPAAAQPAAAPATKPAAPAAPAKY
jgi:hypothetical protein